ncbi:single-stranded DNA-binding protein [Thermodesulfobacteriota bacterium]
MINKAIIVGNLGRDPEVSYTPGGMAVAKFSVATSEKWKDKNTGEMQERTEWHRITAFGRLGEICGEYLSKGRQVFIEGRIQTTSWEKDGITRYSTEIIASEMKMLGTRATGDTYSPSGPSTTPEYTGPPGPEMEDDDIPF